MSTTGDFRACASAYLVLCGPFVAIAVLFAISETWDGFSVCIAVAVAWAVWLAWFQLRVGGEAFTYRSPFRRSRTVPYSLVQGVEITARGPASGAALGVAVQISDGSRVRVNYKVFPREAGVLLMKKIQR